MASCRNSILYAAIGLILMQVASAERLLARDFVPPPNGRCPADCEVPQNQVNSSFFLFRDSDNATPGENGPGGRIIPVHVAQFPALANLGISYTVLDITKCGLSPPHVHPRGTELQYVIKGTMLIGFVDTMLRFRFEVLKAGDIFVVPQGMVHFTQSINEEGFKSVAAFNSEEAGTIFIFSALLDTADATIEATTGLNQKQVQHLREFTQSFASMRPTVSKRCLEDIEAGRPFDFTTGANMLAGGSYMYGK